MSATRPETQTWTAAITRMEMLVFQTNYVVKATTGSRSIREVLEKGLPKKWLKRIYVYAVDRDRRRRAEIKMEIDWERYEVHIVSKHDDVPINQKLPESEQLSVAIAEIVNFFNEFIQENGWSAEWAVNYAPGVDEALADKELGLTTAPPMDWAPGHREQVISEVPRRLDEFRIDLTLVVPD